MRPVRIAHPVRAEPPRNTRNTRMRTTQITSESKPLTGSTKNTGAALRITLEEDIRNLRRTQRDTTYARHSEVPLTTYIGDAQWRRWVKHSHATQGVCEALTGAGAQTTGSTHAVQYGSRTHAKLPESTRRARISLRINPQQLTTQVKHPERTRNTPDYRTLSAWEALRTTSEYQLTQESLQKHGKRRRTARGKQLERAQVTHSESSQNTRRVLRISPHATQKAL
jgi:hypothetical protein